MQDGELTLGQFGSGHGFGEAFCRKLLGPMKKVPRRVRKVEALGVVLIVRHDAPRLFGNLS